MLDLINRVSVRPQRRLQGIPRGSASLYDKLATRILETSYYCVVKDIFKEEKNREVILEVGCGTGRLLLEILGVANPRVLVGLDISYAMIKIAKRNVLKKGGYWGIDFILADAHKMPLRDGSVDLVVSTGTLHHIRSPETLFRELVRVLTEDGEAWIYEFSHDLAGQKLKESARKLSRPWFLIKIAATMHGLPRREYREGYIRAALDRTGVPYSICFEGVVTLLKLKPSKLG